MRFETTRSPGADPGGGAEAHDRAGHRGAREVALAEQLDDPLVAQRPPRVLAPDDLPSHSLQRGTCLLYGQFPPIAARRFRKLWQHQ